MRHFWSAPCRLLSGAILLAALAGLLSQDVAYAQTAAQAYDASFFQGMKWRGIGINRGGRSIAVAGSMARPNEYYFGATGGGVWKTTDGGQSWNPVSDGHFKSSSVGAMAVCEANPDIVYAGMGEVQLRGNIMQGDGIYRSSDGGKSWTHIGLEETQAIARVRVDARDCEHVYVAAFGHPYGPNAERGIFRTRDGGRSWEKILFRNEKAGAIDLVLDPSNPRVLYAGFWEAHRTPWMLSSGGPGSGLFKSVDGGATWTELTKNPGLPTGLWGKVGVSVSGADPNRVYAIIEADEGGVFRSDDAGRTWTRTNEERKLRQRAFYYTRIFADPVERDRVYVINTGFYRSDDGGESFETSFRVPHGDNHDVWIAPNDNQRIINSNDGGANVSVNGGATWTGQAYPTAQFYHVVTTKHVPYHVCGAQQDNSTACTPSDGNGSEFYAVGGGESGYIAPDPGNLDVFYAGSYGGLLTRFDRSTGQSRAINVWPENPMGHSSSEIRERFQWTFPIIFSPIDPKVLYTSSQHLFRSTNGGHSWERISPDLTRRDPKTMGPSGGPITKDQTGVETYATIFTVAPSPHDINTIWTGSDDGLVQVTRDGGKSWQNVTPAGLPEFARISLIEASPHDPGTAYMAAKRYQLDDRAPYIYRTSDYGKSWVKITSGIGAEDYVHAIREDPVRRGLLYAGTEHGVYVSFDAGSHWQSLSLNLPDVQVPSLVVEGKDLVIATHGRSFYILDNITPLRQLTPQLAQARLHLFEPAVTTRSLEQGAAVYYYLRSASDSVKIEILDSRGEVIRSFTGVHKPGEKASEPAVPTFGRFGPPSRVETGAGLQRFVWDLRHEGFTSFPGMIFWAAGNRGPRAVPGQYQVRLTAGGETQTRSFEVRKDPRLTEVTQADLQAQFELAIRVRDKVSEANEAVILIRGIKSQVDERTAAANDRRITSAGEALKARLSAVEEEIYQVRNRSNQDPLNYPIKLNNKIAALLGQIDGGDGRPTEQSQVVFTELSERLAAQLTQLNVVLDRDLEAFNKQLAGKKLPAVTRETVPTQSGVAVTDDVEWKDKFW
jgi:photosystem II stability/assembly factor-like uncharacterized protein